MIFHAYGHPNIKGTHKNTFEFTKEDHLTPTGDCIIGIRSDFDPKALGELVKRVSSLRITLIVGDEKEVISATANPTFSDQTEAVVRIGEHTCPRTLAYRASKSAKYLSRKMMELLKKGTMMEVHIEQATE